MKVLKPSNDNKIQENNTNENSYNSEIETIESQGNKGLSYILDSRDNSTGLCWINAQSENAYKLNSMIPHLNYTSSSFIDPNCAYFYQAKKNLGS
jgi:hypothetical protein